MIEQLLSQVEPFPLLGNNISAYIPIDLSKTNKDLLAVDVSNTKEFESYIAAYLKQQNATVAYGGYNEPRNIYKRSETFHSEDSEERFIHLGVDLWTKVETLVYAPYEGIIHSFANNEGLGNYGPTIILEHQIDDYLFYTLYGHLTLTSIINISQGQTINKGDSFAAIGNYPVNGDYPPHLHFQVIKDIEGMEGDYSGVTSLKDRERNLQNSINPNLLFRV